MRKSALVLIAASLMGVLAPVVGAHAHVDVHVNIGPPPPAVVFEHEPPVVLVPRTRVYYVPDQSDYDLYRYGSYWYVNRAGYWYRANSYSGPFAAIRYESVPHAIVVVPTRFHHHPFKPPHGRGGPPGHGHGHGHDHHD